MAELDAAGGARGGSTRLLAEDELDAAQVRWAPASLRPPLHCARRPAAPLPRRPAAPINMEAF
eukprot:SAG31_NODE_70_length_28117_cov_100.521843_1_plen_63_part_00